MKKKLFSYVGLAALLILLLVLSACADKEGALSQLYNDDNIQVSDEKDHAIVRVLKPLRGIEIYLNKYCKEFIKLNDNFLSVVKEINGKTYIAISGIGKEIKANDMLFTVKGCPVDIVS